MQLFSSSSVPNSTPLDGDTSVESSFSFMFSTAESPLSLTLSQPVSPSELSSLSLL